MKKLVLLTAMVLFSSQTFAQEQTSPPEPPKVEAAKPPPAPAPRTEWMLKFTADELNNLYAAIMELPKKIADPFMARLNAQLTAQSHADAEAAKAAAK